MAKQIVADSMGVVGNVEIARGKVFVNRWVKVAPLAGLAGLAGAVRQNVATDSRQTAEKCGDDVDAQIAAIVARVFGDSVKLSQVRPRCWNVGI
jgi:hypothetical protein